MSGDSGIPLRVATLRYSRNDNIWIPILLNPNNSGLLAADFISVYKLCSYSFEKIIIPNQAYDSHIGKGIKIQKVERISLALAGLF